ncbi:MAG: hypothetical protein R3F43_06055 [bacterium]
MERVARAAAPALDATAGLRAFIAWLDEVGTCFEAPAEAGDGRETFRVHGGGHGA